MNKASPRHPSLGSLVSCSSRSTRSSRSSRSSCSSRSSHNYNMKGGGKLRRTSRASLNSHGALCPFNKLSLRDRNHSAPGSRYFLRSNRGSARTGHEFSKKNEEWDRSIISSKGLERSGLKLKQTRAAVTLVQSCNLRTCMKNGQQTRTKEKKAVVFSQISTLYPGVSTKNYNIDTRWGISPDNGQCSSDAIAHARKINRVMKYLALSESSYNASMGLTSPQTLKEYLSCPEEIIGIEHMLGGQRAMRENLRIRHMNILIGERGQGESDCELLAKRLGDMSKITSHMAQERARYASLLD